MNDPLRGKTFKLVFYCISIIFLMLEELSVPLTGIWLFWFMQLISCMMLENGHIYFKNANTARF